MKVSVLLLLTLSAAFLAVPTVEAHPCNGEPVLDLVDCGIGGHRVYVCGKYVTNYCIWGP